MEKVSIIDIQGVQWAIKDQEAADNINMLKEQLTPKKINAIQLKINPGFSAAAAVIEDITQCGKLYSGKITINNARGNNIGTASKALFATTPFKVFRDVSAICVESISGNILRIAIDSNGDFSILESTGIENGNNLIRGQATWFQE